MCNIEQSRTWLIFNLEHFWQSTTVKSVVRPTKVRTKTKRPKPNHNVCGSQWLVVSQAVSEAFSVRVIGEHKREKQKVCRERVGLTQSHIYNNSKNTVCSPQILVLLLLFFFFDFCCCFCSFFSSSSYCCRFCGLVQKQLSRTNEKAISNIKIDTCVSHIQNHKVLLC